MPQSISIIGSGSTTIGFLLQTLSLIDSKQISESEIKDLTINIFEKSLLMGAGAAYDPSNSGFQHISNIRNNSGTLPQEGADFMAWIASNKYFIHKTFDEIFEQRLQRKIEKRPEKEDDLRKSYELIKRNFREKYLALDKSSTTYHPRILYGIYRIALFERVCELLCERGLKINLFNQSQIIDLEKDEKLTLTSKKIAEKREVKTTSDFVLFAGGMIEKDGKQDHENFLSSQWPQDALLSRLETVLEEAKKAGLTKVRIGILGSSLSAIDAVRTIYGEKIFDEKDFSFDHIKVEIDLISRSGSLPKVRAAFAPFEYKKDKEKKPLPQLSILQEVEDVKAKEGGVSLWKILHLCAEKMEVFYNYFDRQDIAKKAKEFADFILDKEREFKKFPKQSEEEKERCYEEVLEKLSQLELPENFKKEAAISESFAKLAADIKRAEEGDVDGLLGCQVAYGLIGPANPQILQSLEAKDRKIYDKFFATLHNLYDSPMPIPVAQDLLKLFEKDLVKVVKIGYKDFDKSASTDKKYEMIIRCDGYVKDLKQGNILHQKITSGDTRIFAPYQAGIGVAAAQELGRNSALEIMSKIAKREIKKTDIAIIAPAKPKQTINFPAAAALAKPLEQLLTA